MQLRLDLKQAEREEQEIENNDVDVPSAQVSEDMVHGTPSAPSVAAASPALTPGLAPQDAAIGGRVPHMLPPGEPDASAATAAAASAVDRGLVAAMQGAVAGGGSCQHVVGGGDGSLGLEHAPRDADSLARLQ